MSDEAIIRAQRERIDELEEENRQLRERLTGETWQAPRCLGLTKTERKIVGALLDTPEISADRLRFRIYGHEDRSYPLIYVHLTHVRRKLWRAGIVLGRGYGQGHYLAPEDKARLRAMAAREHAGGTSAALSR